MLGGAWFVACCIRAALTSRTSSEYRITNTAFPEASIEGLELSKATLTLVGGRLRFGTEVLANDLTGYKVQIRRTEDTGASVVQSGKRVIIELPQDSEMRTINFVHRDPETAGSEGPGKLDIKCARLKTDGHRLLQAVKVSGKITNAQFTVVRADLPELSEVKFNGRDYKNAKLTLEDTIVSEVTDIEDARFDQAVFEGPTQVVNTIMVGAADPDKRTAPAAKFEVLTYNTDAARDTAVVRSWAEIDLYRPKPDKKDKTTYRIKVLRGFEGPDLAAGATATPAFHGFLSKPIIETYAPDVLVIEDQGNGYRDHTESLVQLEKLFDKKPIILYKATRSLPRPESAFWKLLEKHKTRVIAVISADALRELGVKISLGLSWERTAHDLLIAAGMVRNVGSSTEIVKAERPHPRVGQLLAFSHLVVRLCLSGAVHIRSEDKQGVVAAQMYYSPTHIEKSYRDDFDDGMLTGYNSVLVACVVRSLLKSPPAELEADALTVAVGVGVKDSIACSRAYFEYGLGRSREDLLNLSKPCLPNDHIFDARDREIGSFSLKPERDRPVPPLDTINIFETGFAQAQALAAGDRKLVQDFAFYIIQHGVNETLKQKYPKFPIARFGQSLTVVDREEIEGYRAVSNLLRDYAGKESPPRPLSIAVFGAPGTGKSFGVKQIARSVLSDDRVQFVEVNLAQFTSPDDLSDVFFAVRDITLDASKLPVVFFDEFDTRMSGGDPLGWLKFFLAPMQDAKFKHKQTNLGIGRAVFVFAGGMKETFDHRNPIKRTSDGFNVSDDEIAKLKEEDRSERSMWIRCFRDNKGKDFVSRLRGHINIVGINPPNGARGAASPSGTPRPMRASNDLAGKPDERSVDPESVSDLYQIRRAVLFRSLLEKHGSGLLDARTGARVDDDVVRAFLKVRTYKHGSRSMEAILEMSSLGRHTYFGKSLLPKEEQMEMHVDTADFIKKLTDPSA
jgi:hypothetical protein